MIDTNYPMGVHLFGFFLPFHLLFELLAFYTGLFYFFLRTKKERKGPVSDSQRVRLLLAAAIGALLGSRIVAIIEHYPVLLSHPDLYFLTQSKTIVGGLVGGWIAIEFYKKRAGITASTGDTFLFPLILGIMVGRVGCLSSGVTDGTAGVPTLLPWGYPQGDGIPRHPTALYEILFLGFLWTALARLRKSVSLHSGELFRIFMVFYCLFRLFVDFLKPVVPLFAGLSAIQLVCCGVLFYSFSRFAKRLFPAETEQAEQ